jgi:hypothetical protein
MSARIGHVLLIVAFVGSGLDARAQVESEPEKERARALLREGNAKLDQGLYLDALGRFEQAYAIFPSPKIHFNIAQTLNELGRPLEALDHYERFVRELPEAQSPEQWRLAHEQIFKLQGAIATVEIQCNVVDAQVTVDGQPAGLTPLARSIRLMPGPHALVIAKAGHERQVIESAFKAGDAVTQRIKLVTEEEAAATRSAVQRAETERRASEERLRRAEEETRSRQRRTRSILRTAGWAAVAAGAASLLTSVVLGGLALDNSSSVQGAAPGTPWTDLSGSYDRAASYRVGFYSTLVVGAGLAAAGGVLLVLGRREAGTERRLALVPAASAHAGSLSVIVGF